MWKFGKYECRCGNDKFEIEFLERNVTIVQARCTQCGETSVYSDFMKYGKDFRSE